MQIKTCPLSNLGPLSGTKCQLLFKEDKNGYWTPCSELALRYLSTPFLSFSPSAPTRPSLPPERQHGPPRNDGPARASAWSSHDGPRRYARRYLSMFPTFRAAPSSNAFKQHLGCLKSYLLAVPSGLPRSYSDQRCDSINLAPSRPWRIELNTQHLTWTGSDRRPLS
jgi:hypothetical protein